jgi:hypothetical protein
LLRRRSLSDPAMRPSRFRVRQKVVPLSGAGQSQLRDQSHQAGLSTSKQSRPRLLLQQTHPPCLPSKNIIFMQGGAPKAHEISAENLLRTANLFAATVRRSRGMFSKRVVLTQKVIPIVLPNFSWWANSFFLTSLLSCGKLSKIGAMIRRLKPRRQSRPVAIAVQTRRGSLAFLYTQSLNWEDRGP